MNASELDLALFRGFGGDRRVCVAGRLMRKSQLVPARDDASLFRRLRDGWRLLISRTVPQADLQLRCGNTSWRARTDRHGYFFSCHTLQAPTKDDATWSRYTCRARTRDGATIEASGDIMRAADQAQRIVISDIDDTIVHTGVANKLHMFWQLYFARSGQRVPFPGMSAFLRGLHFGGDGQSVNPMLYVSRSPWSIYPVLDEFFNRHNIPLGPVMLLRDWGISWRHPLPRRAEDHKLQMIERVMHAYPQLPAILVGDSGQRDPEVYRNVVERFPGRVEGIYVRDLALSASRTHELDALATDLSARDVHLVAGKSTEAMAADAAARGWIAADAGEHVHLQCLAETDA